MIEENLGTALRQLRARQHLSLRTLAQRTGFSPSFLSQLENAQSSPSLASIEKITGVLGVSLGQFFQAIEGPRTDGVQDAASKQGQPQSSQSPVDPVGAGDGISLTAVIVTLVPDSSSNQPHLPASDEFAYVLEGGVNIITDTEKRSLRTGEAIMLRAGYQCYWQNVNGTPARVLVVSD